MADDDELIPVFVPALGAVLIAAEDRKGEPLTYEEVIRLRDESACIMMTDTDLRKMAESRGYDDLDPENCWYDWQQLRRELGREPELDSGPMFNQIDNSDPKYRATIQAARDSLDEFCAMLSADGTPRADALIKTRVIDCEQRALMWLMNTRVAGRDFVAEFFEVPVTFREHAVGDELEVSRGSLLDWMVNDGGTLYGGSRSAIAARCCPPMSDPPTTRKSV